MTSIQRWFAAVAIVMLASPAGAGVRHPAACAGADTSSQQTTGGSQQTPGPQQATDPRQTTGEPAGEDELEEDEEPDCE